MKRKKQLLAEAANLRHLVENRILELEVQVQSAAEKMSRTEAILNDAEQSEKSRVIKTGSGTADSVGVLAGLARSRIEELRSHLVAVRAQRDAVDARMKELEAALSALKSEYNPNFNDEGVKRAVRAWEDYAAREKEGSWEDAENRDLDEIAKPDDENNGINFADWESGNHDSVTGPAESIMYGLSAYAPPSLRLWLDAKIASFHTLLIESGILADNPDSNGGPSESAALTAARNQHESAKTTHTKAQNDLNSARTDLDTDYGTSDIFRALKDKCTSKDSGEYTYEVCFLSSTKQKSKKGGTDTKLGNFVGLGSEFSDDDDSSLHADGRGLQSGERVVLKYENGQHCWNGPARSTLVVLGCSAEEEIWRVSESEKCTYRMEVGTAAVCDYQNTSGGRDRAGVGSKDEL
jgi:protein kinase C substrate 80K-H